MMHTSDTRTQVNGEHTAIAGAPKANIELNTTGPWTFQDDMAVSHAQQLETTLKGYVPISRNSEPLAKGSVVPPGSHLVFFNHVVDEIELDVDGYDRLQAPKGDFPVRRWYGGSVEFNISTELRLGHPATCIEEVQHIKGTGPRTQSRRVSVVLQRTMRNDDDDGTGETWAVRERRAMFYFGGDARILLDRQLTRFVEPQFTARYTQKFVPSRVLLFRYSALNFNAHMIHYNQVYSKLAEKLPDVIAQGPLMVTVMIRWISDGVLGGSQRRIQLFDYRNVAPLIVNEEATLCATQITQDSFEVWIQNSRGGMVLTGTVIVA